MRKVYEYSHLGGAEILEVRFCDISREIDDVIRAVDAASARVKVSREKTMPGALLYSPAHLNAAFKREFAGRGFRAVAEALSGRAGEGDSDRRLDRPELAP